MRKLDDETIDYFINVLDDVIHIVDDEYRFGVDDILIYFKELKGKEQNNE